MRVSALAIYPVKGGAATALDACDIDALGLAGDRRFCLARPDGRVFTQRDNAALARLQASRAGAGLALGFDGETLLAGPEDFCRHSRGPRLEPQRGGAPHDEFGQCGADALVRHPPVACPARAAGAA